MNMDMSLARSKVTMVVPSDWDWCAPTLDIQNISCAWQTQHRLMGDNGCYAMHRAIEMNDRRNRVHKLCFVTSECVLRFMQNVAGYMF